MDLLGRIEKLDADAKEQIRVILANKNFNIRRFQQAHNAMLRDNVAEDLAKIDNSYNMGLITYMESVGQKLDVLAIVQEQYIELD